LPLYSGKVLGPSLGLLSLAGSLREAGYEPRIIDGALDWDFAKTVAREISGALCFGVSLLTGPMIRDAVAMSRLVRKLRPELPIIFGGWHPSLQSGQTLREDFVDIAVRHQGERRWSKFCKGWSRATHWTWWKAVGSSATDASFRIPTGLPLRCPPYMRPLTT
jgi:hypothetical protein